MTGGAASGITLHTIQQFTETYIVRFDAWINANGPFPADGTGSTEFLTAGVGGDGITVNRVGVAGSGGYVAMDGEGGSGIDYRMYQGITLQDPASLQYAAGSHATARATTNPYYVNAGFGSIDTGNLPVQGDNNAGPAQQNGTTLGGSFSWLEQPDPITPASIGTEMILLNRQPLAGGILSRQETTRCHSTAVKHPKDLRRHRCGAVLLADGLAARFAEFARLS